MIHASVELMGVAEMRAMLSALPPSIQRELRPRMRQAAELVAAQARANAAWSSRSGRAITTAASFGTRTAGAAVRVSAAVWPPCRAYEGVDGNATFRHPVYGGDTWVTQATRPYLMPAGRAKERAAALLAQEALRAALPR